MVYLNSLCCLKTCWKEFGPGEKGKPRRETAADRPAQGKGGLFGTLKIYLFIK